MPPKPKKKTKVVEEPIDEYTPLDGLTLQSQVTSMRERLNDLKSRRNYIQMDRDMVENFYSNTKKEMDEVQNKCLNYEADAEKLESEHQVDVKVYLQKVKHLEFEQKNNNKNVEAGGEQAMTEERTYHDKKTEDMKGMKTNLKNELVKNEENYIEKVRQKEEHNKGLKEHTTHDYSKRIQDLIKNFEEKTQQLKEDLELKLKVEIHEIEERKNQHINELIQHHELQYAELKAYYNDITAENLNLIKAQREEIAKITKNLDDNRTKVKDLRNYISSLRGPLDKLKKDRDDLKYEVRFMEKDRMSLQSLKSKLIILTDKIAKHEVELNILNEKYDRVLKEKQELENRFENITKEVADHAEIQNMLLSQKLRELSENLDVKEAALQGVIENANLDKNLMKQLSEKIQASIEAKNLIMKNLRYSIHHATKAYNDAIRVYEAKLVEFGIPPEELGFQPLPTVTSTMPAGLVSS